LRECKATFPHIRKGIFSGSSLLSFEIRVARIITAVDNRKVVVSIVIIMVIIFYLSSFHKFIVWKSRILLLYWINIILSHSSID